MAVPNIGDIVYYRLSRNDVKAINRRYQDGVTNYGLHRTQANGTVVHVGNQQTRGSVVPLIVVRVWRNEFDNPVAPDYVVGDEEPEFHQPISPVGLNGQAVLDGNDSLWITSAPHMVCNGGWYWPNEESGDIGGTDATGVNFQNVVNAL